MFMNSKTNSIRQNMPRRAKNGRRGFTKDGIYLVRPDLKMEPLNVNCEFKNGIGWTIFKHNHPQIGTTSNFGDNTGCEDSNCFSQKFSYENSPEELGPIIDLSLTCIQNIMNNCSVVPLTGNRPSKT